MRIGILPPTGKTGFVKPRFKKKFSDETKDGFIVWQNIGKDTPAPAGTCVKERKP